MRIAIKMKCSNKIIAEVNVICNRTAIMTTATIKLALSVQRARVYLHLVFHFIIEFRVYCSCISLFFFCLIFYRCLDWLYSVDVGPLDPMTWSYPVHFSSQSILFGEFNTIFPSALVLLSCLLNFFSSANMNRKKIRGTLINRGLSLVRVYFALSKIMFVIVRMMLYLYMYSYIHIVSVLHFNLPQQLCHH